MFFHLFNIGYKTCFNVFFFKFLHRCFYSYVLVDLQTHFRYCKRFRCLYLKNTICMYKVNARPAGRHVSNYCYCCIVLNWKDCYVMMSTTC